MAEINAMPRNGMSLVSLFSGAGGSCLGARWAGFETLWASEFIESARDVYRANHPTPVVDERDIRDVDPDELLKTIGKQRGEVDVLEGSPPCASFSMAGKRDRGDWTAPKVYSETTQRVDDLFHEFARILEGVQPRAFVAENVPGLVIGKAKGYFVEIFKRLESAGYAVAARVLDAQWLGVPQRRRRLIFVGTRVDLELEPPFPTPLPYRYSIRDALPEVLGLMIDYRTSSWGESEEKLTSGDEPAPTIMAEATGIAGRKYQTDVIRAVGGACAPFDSKGKQISLEAPAPTMVAGQHGGGPHQVLLEGYAVGGEWDKLGPGGQSEKYFNLIRPHEDEPCPTVTQVAGHSPGVAGVTHPTEKRKFTIAELKRICGFPDDFELTGTYSQQWERLGRAVPPPMMYRVASAVRDALQGA